ncbi:MAG TPA: TonB C-terminal domain-containing protein [Sandaracinaceae bacterium]
MSTLAQLRLDPKDGRPDSALRGDWSAAAIAAFLSWLLALLLGAVIGLDPNAADEERERLLEEEDVIEARFVQLGRDFQDELPNREVPVLSTAPPEPSEVPREDTPPLEQPVQRIEDRPPNTVEDLLARLDRRAELFEEMAERRELEGSPEGIEEGTETEGSEGDVYRGRIMSFFRRGWTIPTTLSSAEVRDLTVIVDVEIGDELQIVSFRVRSDSGNPVFDESVVQQLTRLQAADQRIPPPPEEVADQYVGQTIAVRFRGRDAR